MNPIREAGRGLIVLGILLIALGGFFLVGGHLPLHLGRLPGDIVYHGRHSTVYLPIVSCLLLSVALTVVFWIVSALRR